MRVWCYDHGVVDEGAVWNDLTTIVLYHLGKISWVSLRMCCSVCPDS